MSSYSQDFGSPSELTYDNTKIEVTGSVAKLKLQNNPGQDFTENFTNDTGFSYDSTKSEFVAGKLQQKSNRITDAIFGATYTTFINGSWGNGTLTGTASNGATITSNRLDLSGGVSGRKVSYNVDNLDGIEQTGCIKFKFTPNYSGAPTTQQTIISISSGGLSNWIGIYHYTNGYIRLIVYSSAGVNLGEALYYWITNVSGTTYEIEASYDITNGNLYFYVDGTRVAIKTGAIGTRTSAITQFYVGEWYNGAETPNFYLEDLIIFNSVQHTGTSYTPSYTLLETDYLEDVITLPEMEYTGAGTLVSFDNFTTTESGSPRFTLQVGRSGNYLYWSGSAWVTSDGTYNQATLKADFLANLSSLSITGEIYGQFRVHFPDSNTQNYIDILTASLTAQIYPIDNPTIYIPASAFYMDELENFEATITLNDSNNAIKFTQKKDGTIYYYSGGWIESDNTYTKTNTIAEIIAAKSTFTTKRILYGVYIFLHSNDGMTTPEIDLLTITYSYAGEAVDTINKCIVWGISKNIDGTPNTNIITAKLNKKKVKYKNTIIVINDTITATPSNDEGYWEMELIETENMEGTAEYDFTINGITETKVILNVASSNYLDLP